MSVHLKENQCPLAKKGKPGTFSLTKLSDDILSKDYLEFISSQILDVVNVSDSSTLEISKTGASVIQHNDYRIAITHPPFSESFEITIVHPIVKLSLEDYEISDELMKRFSDRAEGIMISGAPGSGKSTLASGLANFYHKKGKIVKTFESPRDLQVDPGVTQYSKLDGSFDNSAEILLLVRPDYTIFDEIRRQEDFRTFADLRLTGVGMVGVVHANSPIDAIQRFIGKIELGIIPNVLDTVVFVKDGRIDKVYDLELKVKVPSGMTESDLARPVIEIRNFADNVLEHEIYTFGEENVIVPIAKRSKKVGIEKLAEDKIKETFRRYDPQAEVEILSDNRVKVFVDEQCIPSIIGRGGSNINDIEKFLKVHIDVVQKDSEHSSGMINGLPFTYSESKTALLLTVGREYTSMHADISINNEYVASVKIGKKGQIKIPKRSDIARNLMNLASSQNDIQIFLKDF
jgi:ATPase